jgi:hypothetical protein
MQAQKFQLQALRVGALPILNRFIARMGIEEELALALKNAGYADALLALLKNILVDRNALYDGMRLSTSRPSPAASRPLRPRSAAFSNESRACT